MTSNLQVIIEIIVTINIISKYLYFNKLVYNLTNFYL
jgi:hypothetical protein